MIFTNYEKFGTYIPTAAGSDIEELKTYLEEAEYWLRDHILGNELYAFIEADPAAKERNTCELIICLKAYREAIPFVDLIQTPNGFAVVRNTNQAPASKERVDALLKQTTWRLSETVDSMLSAILYIHADLHTEWRKSFASVALTQTFYFTARELRQYSGNKELTNNDFSTYFSELKSIEESCSRYISYDYMKVLFERFRDNLLSDSDRHVWNALKTIAGLILQKKEYYQLVENMVNFMVSNIGDFPEFENSFAYRLKMDAKYENQRNHPTFFFGG